MAVQQQPHAAARLPARGGRDGRGRSACGYAALSLMPEGVGVLSVEFKVNLMKPAAGELFRAVARVIRAGRTLSVCGAEVQAPRGGEVTTIAVLQGTMMAVRDNARLVD